MKKNCLNEKYSWEFFRRNITFKKDWTQYFGEPNIEKARELLNKYGPPNFPQSRDFEKSWNEIERIPGTIWSLEWTKEKNWPELEELIIQSMVEHINNQNRVVINMALLAKSRTTGEFRLVVKPHPDRDGNDEYFFINEAKEIIPISKDSIPDEINIKLVNFKRYLMGNIREKRNFQSHCKAIISDLLRSWEYTVRYSEVYVEKRYRFEMYATYLEVWDLVQKLGRKWKRIADIIYPNEPTEVAHVKVQQHYKEACRLIEEQIFDIWKY